MYRIVQLPALIGQLVQDVFIPVLLTQLDHQDQQHDERHDSYGGKDQNSQLHTDASKNRGIINIS